MSMLLAAMPDSVSRDMVSGRCLTAVNMLFRLYTMYQPGGAAERNFLLRQLTDLKVGASPGDILSSVKTWRRWMRRAEELSITLPDSLVLSTALTRMSEALAKCGGTQVSYRIASMRQELSIDLRPTMMAVRDMAEYLEAEAEELSLLIGRGSLDDSCARLCGWAYPGLHRFWAHNLWKSMADFS